MSDKANPYEPGTTAHHHFAVHGTRIDEDPEEGTPREMITDEKHLLDAEDPESEVLHTYAKGTTSVVKVEKDGMVHEHMIGPDLVPAEKSDAENGDQEPPRRRGFGGR